MNEFVVVHILCMCVSSASFTIAKVCARILGQVDEADHMRVLCVSIIPRIVLTHHSTLG